MSLQEAQVDVLLSLNITEEWASNIGDGQGWRRNSPVPVCAWYGITCDDGNDINGAITKIQLSDANLQSTIPTEFGRLHALQILDLSYNSLVGTLPPQLFTSIDTLEEVTLHHNLLEGTVTPCIFKSPSLLRLNLDNNQFEGSIVLPPPSEIQYSSPLEEFSIQSNFMTGELPKAFCLVAPRLIRLNLSSNHFWSSLRNKLEDCEALQILDVRQNWFQGPLPTRLSYELTELFVQHNFFTGTVPAEYALKSQLKDLFLQGNKLTGTIPKEVCDIDKLNEKFYSTPIFVNNPHNTPPPDGSCHRISCDRNTYSHSGVGPCEPCPPHRLSPHLGTTGGCVLYNQLDIMSHFVSESQTKQGNSRSVSFILDTVTDIGSSNSDMRNTGGESDISNGRQGPSGSGSRITFKTDDELCQYDGITCNDDLDVVEINFSNREMQNSIPSSLGYLTKLERLDLSNNQFTGLVPSELQFAPLQELELVGNFLIGIVPDKLCMNILPPTEGEGNGSDGGAGGMNMEGLCSNILCPVGTYSNTGKAPCYPCESNIRYLGCTSCDVTSSTSSSSNSSNGMPSTKVLFAIACIATFSVACCLLGITVCCCLKRKQVQRKQQQLMVSNREISEPGSASSQQEEEEIRSTLRKKKTENKSWKTMTTTTDDDPSMRDFASTRSSKSHRDDIISEILSEEEINQITRQSSSKRNTSSTRGIPQSSASSNRRKATSRMQEERKDDMDFNYDDEESPSNSTFSSKRSSSSPSGSSRSSTGQQVVSVPKSNRPKLKASRLTTTAGGRTDER